MTDFLLELLSEEIPARMQDKAREDLARLFAAEIARSGLTAEAIETFATPRRLALIARGLPLATQAVATEVKGPRADAPAQALAGFLGKTGLTREQLVERTDAKGNVVLFAVTETPGRATAEVLAEAVAAVVRGFPWPKSMRWGAASRETTGLRWVRPLTGIVALLGEAIVPVEIDGLCAGAATVGHRFHHPGVITIGSAEDYAAKLRACHVIVDQDERRRIVRDCAAAVAAEAGLTVVPDEGLVAENAGLTEWPVPLLGSFDRSFLEVPREVIQLTMRTNQKYFALVDGDGRLAPNFVCTANIEAVDGGASIVAGNEKVLSARLSDARFFWEQDLKVPLGEQARKLSGIVFHEKLGTIADKVERVAKLARWLVEEGIVSSTPSPVGGGASPVQTDAPAETPHPNPSPEGEGLSPADMAEMAARLCKADLVTGMVGEFPELQGVMGGYYAAAEGLPVAVSDAIRDHYKPVGQGDDVPTAPVTVAVSLADKLDTLISFFAFRELPTGSRDPYALRRAANGVIAQVLASSARLPLMRAFTTFAPLLRGIADWHKSISTQGLNLVIKPLDPSDWRVIAETVGERILVNVSGTASAVAQPYQIFAFWVPEYLNEFIADNGGPLLSFFADRLKVQQREAGVRHDLIDAVFALGGEDDLVRLLARVHALQAFVASEDGVNLLAGYKRAANILRIEEGRDAASTVPRVEGKTDTNLRPDDAGCEISLDFENRFGYTPLSEEAALLAALDVAEPAAVDAVEREDFAGAMRALAALRGPIDGFFDTVKVNDDDPVKRVARLGLLARIRDAMHRVADFSKIEG